MEATLWACSSTEGSQEEAICQRPEWRYGNRGLRQYIHDPALRFPSGVKVVGKWAGRW
jgi:hypothetical protein